MTPNSKDFSNLSEALGVAFVEGLTEWISTATPELLLAMSSLEEVPTETHITETVSLCACDVTENTKIPLEARELITPNWPMN